MQDPRMGLYVTVNTALEAATSGHLPGTQEKAAFIGS